jgi:acyl carrier protein
VKTDWRFTVQDIISAETVLVELKRAIVGATGISEELIKPDSVLTRDLGAESLDFLDINYRMEQTFGLKMARHSVLVHAEELFGEGSVLDAHARLTKEAVVLLGMRFRENATHLRPGIDMEEVLILVTVQSMVEAVMDIIHTRLEQCRRCGHNIFQSQDGCRAVCSSCGENATYLNGDDLIKEWLVKVQEEQKIFK